MAVTPTHARKALLLAFQIRDEENAECHQHQSETSIKGDAGEQANGYPLWDWAFRNRFRGVSFDVGFHGLIISPLKSADFRLIRSCPQMCHGNQDWRVALNFKNPTSVQCLKLTLSASSW